jgi:hypothetical protein
VSEAPAGEAEKPWRYDGLLDSVRRHWDAHDKTCKSLPHMWLGRKGGVSCLSDFTDCSGCEVTFFWEGLTFTNEDDPAADADEYLCECCLRKRSGTAEAVMP